MGKGTSVEDRQTRPEAAGQEGPSCRHHWLIESPRGATSKGRCKFCGAEREFRNSASDNIWEDDSISGYGRWSGIRSSVPKPSDDDEIAASAASNSRQPAMTL